MVKKNDIHSTTPRRIIHNQVNVQLRNEYYGLLDAQKKTYVKTRTIQHRTDPTLLEIDVIYKE